MITKWGRMSKESQLGHLISEDMNDRHDVKIFSCLMVVNTFCSCCIGYVICNFLFLLLRTFPPPRPDSFFGRLSVAGKVC